MQIPKDLIEQIAKGRAVAFIGAGLSQGAGLPGWPQLLKQMMDWGEQNRIAMDDRKELEEYIESGELLMAAEELRERLGKSAFHQFMMEVFLESKPEPTAAHQLLPKIPFSAVLTTNYDKLLEAVYVDPSIPSFTHLDHAELSKALWSGEFYLLKLHGTIDRIESVVLGTTDYREVMHNNRAYRQCLSTLFSSKTVLFIGFGLTDRDLNLLLDELRSIFHDYTGTHYALMNTADVKPIKQKRFEKDYNIKILPYTPSAPHHPEVEVFLKELAKEVNKIKKESTMVGEPQVSPVGRLSQEVKSWLQALKYDVTEPKQQDDRIMEMEAVLDQGTVKQRVLVRCIGDEIKASDVGALDEVLTRNMPQGWLIADKRISKLAKERAAGDEAYRLFTLAEFLETMVWKNYFNELEILVKNNKIHERYVDLACFRQEMDEKGEEVGRDKHPNLDNYIDSWLNERSKVHFSLLGEFGSGKTWFCRHYAYRQLERYKKDPVNQRLPLLITLRDFTKALTAEQLVNDALLVKYKLPLMGNAYEVFKDMNRQGKLLLILDGFDEMARKVDYQTVVDNFWELADNLADDNSKVLLTSHTEYFRWAKESEKIFDGKEKGRATIRLSPPRFEVFHLEPFNDDQIRQVIVNCLGKEKGEETAARILENHTLAEMARKPVLIELLLAAMEDVNPEILENQALVYLYATNKLLLRNIDTKRTFTSTADKLYFLCEFAWEMISCQELKIHYKDIPLRIQTYFGDKVKDSHLLDHWDFDLRSQTLLHRDAAGNYEFAHKSLAEYFVAFKFAAELDCLATEFKETYKEENGQNCQIPIEVKEMEALAKTFGAMSIYNERLDAVIRLLGGMLAKDAEDRLWKVLHETRGKTLEQVQYVGGNVTSILYRWLNVSFKGGQLPQVVLKGNCFKRKYESGSIDLAGISFRNSILHQLILGECNLEKVDMRDADIKDIELTQPKIYSLIWLDYNNLLVGGFSEGNVRSWDTQTWQESIIFTGLEWEICSIVSFKDARKIVFGDRGNTAILWNLESANQIQHFKNSHTGRHQMAISLDGEILAIADNDQVIKLFDISSGKVLKTFAGTTYFYGVSFNHDGTKLIGGDEKGYVTIWDVENGREVKKWNSELETVFKICHSRNQSCFLATGSITRDKNIAHCWDSETGKSVFSFHYEFSLSISYNHKEDRFAVGDTNNLIKLFDAKSGELIHEIKVGTGTDALAFSPDDRFLASGHDDSTLRIWNVDENSPDFGKCVKIIDVKTNCRGMQIAGAKGLEQKMEWRKNGKPYQGTLLEYFAECGAVLDEEQKKLLKKIKKLRS
ncbi:MAG: NACHT domain-containing protein [Candidatus Aminicenantes bacterium]|nr:NACHT domain-containing protein [Candidatus Aminicenantes bacterium]NIM78648.1 NACHT domain-containing protein [Candidatus Aminicenantes bacterium]NIN17895.1 NACHT domain-containing protein [Candidatus Aminicenantes bacterium]NIN41798.1 NACHT domain-containing protein [Candidatus Aminicenantes bacterium]NIN84550.1 NACHT domain-containing protein [Candidatus Aminicenantes bacterium]